MPSLLTLECPNKDASSKDITKISFSFLDNPPNAGFEPWAKDFLELAGGAGTNPIRNYLASCLDQHGAGWTGKVYDLGGHLDGSPHGSPVQVFNWTEFDSPFDSNGNQLAAVITMLSADYASTPTSGGSGPVPTPESAQDMGAPAVHTGTLRMKQRQAARIYLGPLGDVHPPTTHDVNLNPLLDGALRSDVQALMPKLVQGGSNDHGLALSVWSRRNASMARITHGWIDAGIKTRRKREFVPNIRDAW